MVSGTLGVIWCDVLCAGTGQQGEARGEDGGVLHVCGSVVDVLLF